MTVDVGESLLQQACAADGRQSRSQRVKGASSSVCARQPVELERREGLVEVSHHDLLLRVKDPAQQLAVGQAQRIRRLTALAQLQVQRLAIVPLLPTNLLINIHDHDQL